MRDNDLVSDQIQIWCQNKFATSYVATKQQSTIFGLKRFSNCGCEWPALTLAENQFTFEYFRHRRRIYTEAKANCRSFFLGENGRPHASITVQTVQQTKIIKGGQGQNCGGIFICILNILLQIDWFPLNVLQHSSKNKNKIIKICL